jgi:hypothetical protein
MYTPGVCDITTGNRYEIEEEGLEVCLEIEKKVYMLVGVSDNDKAFSLF